MILRSWRESDRALFARMNADPLVMRFFPAPLTRQESDEFFDRIAEHHVRHGFGPMVIACDAGEEFAGLCGLAVPTWEAAFTPCVEIGWRVRAEFQNRGWATAAARAALSDAFGRLGLPEVLSFTVPENLASLRVMEKLGMRRDARSDFDHPRLAPGHPLRRHVLYRLTRQGWQAGREGSIAGSGGEPENRVL